MWLNLTILGLQHVTTSHVLSCYTQLRGIGCRTISVHLNKNGRHMLSLGFVIWWCLVHRGL